MSLRLQVWQELHADLELKDLVEILQGILEALLDLLVFWELSVAPSARG